MNLFRDLERVIDEKLRGLFPVQKRELIEIQRAILDEIAEPGGRGESHHRHGAGA
jgi:hypothetical protein